MILRAVVRSSECWETVGRTVTGKSQVIVSTNELFRVSIVVAMAPDPESSSWAEEALDLWAEFRLRTNWK